MIEYVESGGKLFAIILRNGYSSEGLTFFTPEHFSQQLGYMNHPGGHQIKAHVHNKVERVVEQTMEVMFVKSGKVLLDVYSESKDLLAERELSAGDVAFLAYGGHGMTMLEDSEIIEVKQGPYLGDMDKEKIEKWKSGE